MLVGVLLIILSFLSCSAYAVPKWVQNPPKITGYMVGIGIAEDISLSKQSALVDIANSLTSNVSSEVSSTIKTSGSNSSNATLSVQNIISDNVLLPQVEWDEIVVDNGVVYTLAKVKISDIVNLYEDYLDIALSSFTNILKKDKINISDYIFILANNSILQLSASRSRTVSALSINAAAYHRDIENIYNKRNKFIKSNCFAVKKSNDTLADKIYLPVIESVMQSNQLRLSNSGPCIVIKFRAKTERLDSSIANVTMQIDIGQPAVVSKIVKFRGESKGSYKSAMLDAANNFSNYFMANNGILTIFSNHSSDYIEI